MVTSLRLQLITALTMTFTMLVLLVLALPGYAHADYAGAVKADQKSVKQGIKKPSYSPYAGRGFPTQVYWGDTHVHTDNSLDARGFGVTIGPEEAYRFARGEEVVTSSGMPFKLSRPLDWLVVSDHSDGMGAMKEVIAGNPNLLKDPQVRKWHEAFREGGGGGF